MQLLKSGVTIVTAVAMYTTLSTKLAKLQWLAILLQVSSALDQTCFPTILKCASSVV